jgi:hypothetical protein
MCFKELALIVMRVLKSEPCRRSSRLFLAGIQAYVAKWMPDNDIPA